MDGPFLYTTNGLGASGQITESRYYSFSFDYAVAWSSVDNSPKGAGYFVLEISAITASGEPQPPPVAYKEVWWGPMSNTPEVLTGSVMLDKIDILGLGGNVTGYKFSIDLHSPEMSQGQTVLAKSLIQAAGFDNFNLSPVPE
jgi:hypothetical protein